MIPLGVRALIPLGIVVGVAAYLAGADQSVVPTGNVRHIRATGAVQALRVSDVHTPSLRGPGGRLTLIRLIPNGARVKPGDPLAEFDRTQQVDDARDAKAKVEDLTHQIDQLRAQGRSDAAK